MTIVYEERLSDSPYVETVTRGQTVSNGSIIRPAEIHWHMVLRKLDGGVHLLVVGPWTKAGALSWSEGAEMLWIKLKLGTFMPHLTTRNLRDMERVLPGTTRDSFWLKDSAWQFPDYENADTFVDRLVRNEILVRDPVVSATLNDQLPEMPSRTLRHRFLRATGLTQSHIWQMKRAQQAMALLQQGVSILDTVDMSGYFDQPHLTRSLKQFFGRTPAQIIHMSRLDCHSVQDSAPSPSYHTDILAVTR